MKESDALALVKSEKLLTYRRRGSRLVLAADPRIPVSYRPRYVGDWDPWVIDGEDELRYPPECIVAVTADGSRWTTGELLA